MAWQEDRNDLMSAGYTDTEVQGIASGIADHMNQNGYQPKDFEDYFGKPPEPEVGKMTEYMNRQFEAHMPSEDAAKEATHEPTRWDAVKAGLQNSVLGLRIRGEIPNTEVEQPSLFSEGAPWYDRVIQGATQTAADLPVMGIGAAMGSVAGPVGVAGGAFAVPQGLRASLMASYQNGGVHTPSDFLNVAKEGIVEGAKGFAVGAATAGGAAVGKSVAASFATTGLVKASIPIATELSAMTHAQAIVDQKMPTLQDITDNAMMMVGFHAATAPFAKNAEALAPTDKNAGGSGGSSGGGGNLPPPTSPAAMMMEKLSKAYSETGKLPGDINAQTNFDPVLKQEMLGGGVETPRTFADQKEPIIEHSAKVMVGEKLMKAEDAAKQGAFTFTGKPEDFADHVASDFTPENHLAAAKAHDPEAFKKMDALESELAEINAQQTEDQKPSESKYSYSPMDTSQPTEGKQFYHGTKAENLNTLTDANAFPDHVKNKYGDGFYMTDNPDIAKSYADNKGKGKKGKVLSAKLNNLNLLDLEKPLPDNVKDIFNKALPSEIEDKLGSGIKGTDAFDHLKQSMTDAGYSESDAADVYAGLNSDLINAGYHGLRHEGKGAYGGRKMGEHNVAILFGDHTGSISDHVNNVEYTHPDYEKEARLEAAEKRKEQIKNEGNDLKARITSAFKMAGDTLEKNLKDKILNANIAEDHPDSKIMYDEKTVNPELVDPSDEYPTLGDNGKQAVVNDPSAIDELKGDNADFTPENGLHKALEDKPHLAYEVARNLMDDGGDDGKPTVRKMQIVKGEKARNSIPLKDALVRYIFDNTQPFNKVYDSSSDENIRNTPVTNRVSSAIIHARASVERGVGFIENGIHDPETGKIVHEGLKDIFKSVPKEQVRDFKDYLMYLQVQDDYNVNRARDAENQKLGLKGSEKNKLMELHVPEKEASDFLAANKEKFQGAAKRVVDFMNALSQYAIDSGDLSQEELDGWKESRPNYVPANRVDVEGTNKGSSTKSAPYKTRTGSESPYQDPYYSLVDKVMNVARFVEKGEGGRRALDLNESLPEDEKILEMEDMPLPESGKAPNEFFTKDLDKDVKLNDNQSIIRVRGQRKLVTFKNPDLARLLNDTNYSNETLRAVKMILKPAEWIAKAIRYGVSTGANFSMAHEVRSQIRSWKVSTTGDIGEVFKSLLSGDLKGAYDNLGRIPFASQLYSLPEAIRKGDDYQEARRAGALDGGSAIAFESFDNYKKKLVNDEMGGISRVQNLIKTVWGANHALIGLLNQADRLAEFRLLKKENPTANFEELQNMGAKARLVTVDALQKGAAASFLSAYIPFMQFGIQGLAGDVAAFKNRAETGYGKKVSTLLGLTVAAYFAGRNNKEIQNLPQEEKDNYWHIPIPGYGVVKFAKDWGDTKILCSLLTRTLRAALDHDSRAFNGFGEMMLNDLPFGLPAIYSVYQAMHNNHDTYTGRNIMPEQMMKLAPQDHYKPYTSEVAKKLSGVIGNINGIIDHATHGTLSLSSKNMLNLDSPMIADYAIKTFTGQNGQMITQLLDHGITHQPIKIKSFDDLADTPYLGAFVTRYPTYNALPLKQFSEDFHRIEPLYNSYMKAIQEGRTKDSSSLLKMNPEITTYPILKEYNKTMGEINKNIQMIETNTKMTKNDKLQATADMWKTMHITASTGLNTIDKAKKGK